MPIFKVHRRTVVDLSEPFLGVSDKELRECGQARLDEMKLKYGHLMPQNEKNLTKQKKMKIG